MRKKPFKMDNEELRLAAETPASRTALSNRIIHHLRGSVGKTAANYNVSECVTRVGARQKGCDHLSTADWGVFKVHQYKGNTLLLWLFLRRRKQQGCRCLYTPNAL